MVDGFSSVAYLFDDLFSFIKELLLKEMVDGFSSVAYPFDDLFLSIRKFLLKKWCTKFYCSDIYFLISKVGKNFHCNFN
jgi:hypothetical protein